MRYIIFLFVAITAQSFGQCSYYVEGHITDSDSHKPIEAVYISISELNLSTYSDSDGYFKISSLCEGEFSVSYAHIGCEDHFNTILVDGNKSIDVELKHGIHQFDDVTLIAESSHHHKEQVIDENIIADNATKGFSEILENISGVSLLKTGSNISKPIVEGLSGNRVVLLNNGVAQSGQQWGADHSPEIDPLVADNIQVIKGARSLQYSQSNRGEVVMVQPPTITKNPRLNGKFISFLESNGRLFSNHLSLEKFYKTLGWRFTGTYKRGGDRKTPNYYLTNTGIREYNFSFDLRKEFSDKLSLDLYTSTFVTDIAVFRGAHLSNKDQVIEAYTRPIPFFVEDSFSYDINAPRQDAKHLLAKAKLKYFYNDNTWTEVIASFQNNRRKEYDIRRGGRSNKAALDIDQNAIYIGGSYNKEWEDSFLNTGLQVNIVDNTNVPGTGILPLVPDYRSFEPSIYAVYGRSFDNIDFNIGSRLDYFNNQALVIEGDVKKEVKEYISNIPTFSINSDVKYEAKYFNTTLNLSYLTRPPAINELYSGGLHQGVSGIEEGNPDLKNEQSYKASFGLITTGHGIVELEAVVFYQRFKNYIYLQPLDEVRTTIRGAYQVFAYRQDDARIMGVNLKSKVKVLSNLKVALAADFLKGDNLGQNVPLLFMPSNSLSGGLEYAQDFDTKVERVTGSVHLRHVLKQTNFDPSQDVISDTPDAYSLLNFKLAVDSRIIDKEVRWTLNVDNALNTSYRDNANRQKYFTDEMGRNISLGIQAKF